MLRQAARRVKASYARQKEHENENSCRDGLPLALLSFFASGITPDARELCKLRQLVLNGRGCFGLHPAIALQYVASRFGDSCATPALSSRGGLDQRLTKTVV